MTYTIQQLAALAGVSVRTLHHYDQIGLLHPSRNEKNGYRVYEHRDLLFLQQILFYRELDFSLEEIGKLLHDPRFDLTTALRDQRHMLELKKKRLTRLIATITKTLQHTSMTDENLYSPFSTEELEIFQAEAKERWGNTDAYQQSQERYAKMSAADKQRVGEEGVKLLRQIAAHMSEAPAAPEVQALIAQHYHGLRAWYEPNIEMYRGLGAMYAADPRFAKFFDGIQPGLADYMAQAIAVFCDKVGGTI
jgi:DNA-binding transcriptional MerR regulator